MATEETWNAAYSVDSAARLPRVPMRLPSELVRPGAYVVHPVAQLDPERVPAQHPPAGSFQLKLADHPVARDGSRTAHCLELCRSTQPGRGTARGH